ncbi:RagB/SusD family nutrient uptake outer membrane protein [Dyadobacter tibetensis]|uniref:RagB/SusD family nutrient uptake outer membrane protein n=1 Tax=Dyadobacter tibetensis TaxID=1211851 RepID=UPI00046FB909|nr:RagB/SusD family nutrient uptake outer membrane protein [Dyadobacter tibetensis]
MRKHLLQIIFLGTLFLIGGCKDSFLDLAPVSNPNAGNFYKTKSDFDLAATAAYNTLYTVYNPQGPVSYIGELMSDNVTIYNISGNQADKWQFRDYKLASSNTMMYQFWQDFYRSIYNVNIVIEKLEKAELDSDFKSKLRGEMLFLRGLYYYHMVQIWGEVPLVTRTLTASESLEVPRSSIADVLTQITRDVAEAKTILPVTASIVGRATKGAAQTLLGKIYLVQNDKTNAAKEFLEVYNSQKYSLLPNYISLWDPKVKNTAESIFEIQRLGGSATAPFSLYYNEFFPNSNALGFYGSGMNQVVEDLWKEYEAGDMRRLASIDTGFVDAKGSFTAAKFPKKWVDKTAPIVGQSAAANNNFMVFRYADLLLLLTEATGDVQYLNQVRKRAGLPLYGDQGYPAQYSTVALATEHERRVELAFEFHRWFDLKRTGRAISVLKPKGKDITNEKLMLPIPGIVRDQNPLITQNKGY